ncbi:MAG: YbjN domain-containing protein [Actinomycetota bacterium]|nr:YbjN domain-containing protein [Actinomycetota bacterium]
MLTGDTDKLSRTKQQLRELIVNYLKEHSFDWEPDSDDSWYVRMDGDNKKGIALTLRIGDRTLQVESYFIRAPELPTQAAAYRWILQRNFRQYIRFACDDEGAIHLMGNVPLECVDEDELDRLIGSVLEYQDDNFKAFLEIGFPKALEAIRQGKPVPEE